MKVHVFHSYSGGCGTSLLAVNLAELLSKNFKVLLIEVELRNPTYTYRFNIQPKYYINDFFKNKDIHLSELLVRIGNIDIISSDPIYEEDFADIETDYNTFIKNFKDMRVELNQLNYDYVVIDLSSGTSPINGHITSIADQINIVLRYDAISFHGVSKLVKDFYNSYSLLENKITCFIFNQVPQKENVIEKIDYWIRQFQSLNRYHSIYNIVHYNELICQATAERRYRIDDRQLNDVLLSIINAEQTIIS